MPCPTQQDLDDADALVVVAYDNWQTSVAEYDAASVAMMNSQTAYYYAAYYASSLWMEWYACNQGNRSKQAIPPTLIIAAIEFCRKFEKECPQIAAGQQRMVEEAISNERLSS